jgi:hypothetical protein
LLPYEDFAEVYNPVMSAIETIDLQPFVDLNVFERNNWNNDDVVSFKKAEYVKKLKKYNLPMLFLAKHVKKAIKNGELPQMLAISDRDRDSNSDFIVYTWDDSDFSKKEKREMMKKGDFSYVSKGLFQKVYVNGVPLKQYYTSKEGKVYESYLYKMVNAWGDGFRANEFYDTAEQSIIDNDFLPAMEMDNLDILAIVDGDKKISDTGSLDFYEVDEAEDVPEIKPKNLPPIKNKNKNNC